MRRADDKSDECWGSIKGPVNHGPLNYRKCPFSEGSGGRAMMQSGQRDGWRALAAGRRRSSGVMTAPRHAGVSGLSQGTAG